MPDSSRPRPLAMEERRLFLDYGRVLLDMQAREAAQAQAGGVQPGATESATRVAQPATAKSTAAKPVAKASREGRDAGRKEPAPARDKTKRGAGAAEEEGSGTRPYAYTSGSPESGSGSSETPSRDKRRRQKAKAKKVEEAKQAAERPPGQWDSPPERGRRGRSRSRGGAGGRRRHPDHRAWDLRPGPLGWRRQQEAWGAEQVPPSGWSAGSWPPQEDPAWPRGFQNTAQEESQPQPGWRQQPERWGSWGRAAQWQPQGQVPQRPWRQRQQKGGKGQPRKGGNQKGHQRKGEGRGRGLGKGGGRGKRKANARRSERARQQQIGRAHV